MNEQSTSRFWNETIYYYYYALGTQNFEPLDPEIGVGFHLEKAETDVYSLPPRGTVTIPISVMSSMWGTYTDLLQLQVNLFIKSRIFF